MTRPQNTNLESHHLPPAIRAICARVSHEHGIPFANVCAVASGDSVSEQIMESLEREVLKIETFLETRCNLLSPALTNAGIAAEGVSLER